MIEIKRFLGESIYTGKVNIDEAETDQNKLLENIVKFNNKSKPKTKEGKDKNWNIFENLDAFCKSQELTLNAFKSRIFRIKAIKFEERPSDLAMRLKIWSPKQIFQRLSKALA